jgi:hypothetical protein
LINPRLFKEINDENDNEIKYDLNNTSSDEIKNNIEIVIKKDLELQDLLLQNLNYVILSLLTFLKYNKIKSVDSILKIENFNILLSYIWLLDEPKKTKYFETCKNNYISFMILFLQISSSEYLELKNIKIPKNDNITINDFEKPHKVKKYFTFSILNNTNKEEEENPENLFIIEIYKKALQNSKNQHIFFNLSLIIVKSNLMDLLPEAEIGSLKTYFMNEIQSIGKSNNHEYKKIIYFSYLQLLVSYYCSETKYAEQSQFHDFICNLNLDIDLFYAFISLFRTIINFIKSDRKDLISYEMEDLKKLNNNDYLTFSDLPLRDINIKSLNDLGVDIIKNIFLDILVLLDKLMKKIRFKDKPSNLNNI